MGNPDGFCLEEFLDRFLAAFASFIGAFVTAKRRSEADRAVSVDPDGSRLQPVRYTQRTADIRRSDASREAKRGVIGNLNRFCFVLKRDHGQHWADTSS